MHLMVKLLETEDNLTQKKIEKLQRQRNTGEISDDEYEGEYESVMQDFRLRFAMVMDGRAWDAYKTYKK